MFHQRSQDAGRRRRHGNRSRRSLLLRGVPLTIRREPRVGRSTVRTCLNKRLDSPFPRESRSVRSGEVNQRVPFTAATASFLQHVPRLRSARVSVTASLALLSCLFLGETATAQKTEAQLAPPLLAVLPHEHAAMHATRAYSISPAQARQSFQWLAELAVDQLPRTIEGDKGWGETKKVWAGVSIRRDGLRLKTHRKFRELRHGRWARYQLILPARSLAPARRPLEIAIAKAELTPKHRWQISTVLTVPMQFETRLERWNLGFQWYSIAVRGDLRVRLETDASIGLYADYSEVPPALTVDPHVDAAKLVLERFEVDRISKVGGDFAEGVGEIVEEVIEETWLKRENERLVEKLNQKIDKKRAELRWSLWDFLSKAPLATQPPLDRHQTDKNG